MDLKYIKQLKWWMSVSILSLFLMASCDSGPDYERSTGKTNEILVVTNSKSMWEGEIGAPIKRFFEEPLPGLPQPEPRFKLFNVAEKDFNKVFKSMHNILVVDINPAFEEPLVETRTDHWSQPQRLIKITAPDAESFYEVFETHKSAFLKAYNELEIERTNTQLKMARSVQLANILQEKFGFSMQLPSGFVVAAQSHDFMWLRQSMHKVKQDVEIGIMICTEPYIDTSSFNPEHILNLRDSLSSKFIPGPSEGSYMILSRGFVEPIFTTVDDFVTGFAIETRGLWMVENDFMGGPFISYTFVDPQLERVITVDAYVYNPGDLKRNFIRQMEAIFHTIDFKTE